jgi:hypothetical protein
MVPTNGGYQITSDGKAQMKHKLVVILFALVMPILLAVGSTGLAEEPEVVEIEGRQAKVTLVEGRAELSRKEPELRL